MESRIVIHPQFGPGQLLKTYMGGFEWEVQFDSGRRFRLPAREFQAEAGSAGLAFAGQPPAERTPRTPTLDLDQFRARQTLEALRFGIVPVQDSETLTIGLEAERVRLDRALARSLERGGDVLAVIGDYGFGKSHFIELAARRSLRQNCLVAVASLDLVEVPPGKASQIYRALTAAIRYPDSEERGLAPLIKKALDTPGVVSKFVALAPDPATCPICRALTGLVDCPSQLAFEHIVEWLAGERHPTAEMRTYVKKPPRLYVTGDVARLYSYLLTGLSVLATLVGYGGLAVLIDESEHYSLLRATQRGRADAFFTAMIYAALGSKSSQIDPTSIPEHGRVAYPLSFASSPHLFFLFALTESENRMPVDAWLKQAQILRLDDRFIERDLREFFQTLARYHSIGYEPADAEHAASRHAALIQQVPGLLAQALNQHRVNVREVIRISVFTWDLLYMHPHYQPEHLIQELAQGLRL